MKKIMGNKNAFVIIFIGTIICLILIIVAIVAIYSHIINKFCIVLLIPFIAEIVFSPFLLNRFGYFVYFDEISNQLCRKGLFWGYKYSINILNIEKVEIATWFREGVFIMFFDDKTSGNIPIKSKKYIRINYNENNLEFVKSFYKLPIENNINKIYF